MYGMHLLDLKESENGYRAVEGMGTDWIHFFGRSS